MLEIAKETATMDEMLVECIRARSESRCQVLGRLNALLIALAQGNPVPKSEKSNDLWVLHADGRTVRYSNC